MILGIGIDIVAISRFEKIIKNKPQSKLNKIFSEHELSYCFKKANSHKIAESLAGKFAAKEAFVKALGTGFGNGIYWSLIEVINDSRGKPQISINSKIKSQITQILSCTEYNIHLSISNDNNSAVAQVIIER